MTNPDDGVHDIQTYVLDQMKTHGPGIRFRLNRGIDGKEIVIIERALADGLVIRSLEADSGPELVSYAQIRGLHPSAPQT